MPSSRSSSRSVSYTHLSLEQRGVVLGAAAAYELEPGAGADQIGPADLPHREPHRHSYRPQMHADKCVADIYARVGLYPLYGYRVGKSFIGGGGKGAAGLGLGHGVYLRQTISLGGGALDDERAVEMLTALGRQIDAVFF